MLGELPLQFRDLVLVHPLATSYALWQVAAGPDAAEEGHAAMLRFIHPSRNRKMGPARGAEQTGVFSTDFVGESSEVKRKPSTEELSVPPVT